MTYYMVYVKMEMGKELKERDKINYVREVLQMRLGKPMLIDRKLAKRISDEIGSQWELPMPVAASDLPELVEEYFHKFR